MTATWWQHDTVTTHLGQFTTLNESVAETLRPICRASKNTPCGDPALMASPECVIFTPKLASYQFIFMHNLSTQHEILLGGGRGWVNGIVKWAKSRYQVSWHTTGKQTIMGFPERPKYLSYNNNNNNKTVLKTYSPFIFIEVVKSVWLLHVPTTNARITSESWRTYACD